MSIFTRDSKLSDVILSDPSVIQVINRFGILLGVGDSTIRSVCESHGIEERLFLAILNTYLNGNYFPEASGGRIELDGLINYLEKTDFYYRDLLLPNIERHFSLLISKSGEQNENSNLYLLRRFFFEVKEEMLALIRRDLDYWFPIVVDGQPFSPGEGESEEVTPPFDDHTLEEKISDLLHFFVIHLRGDYDSNLCVAVVTALSTLGKDVKQNNRIRDRILKPLCQKLL